MPRDPPVVFLYPLSNYKQGAKGSLLEKDSSVKERMLRMQQLYKKLGMRRVVEGLLIAHEHSHPFLLLLQIGNTYFKLPGGRLRPAEHETDGLRRKLENKLGTPNKEYSINWQVGELVSTWWRPNFETVMYPYVPPQVAAPKESRKIFLTQLPPTGILGVPKNLKLLAVPLFELYDNAHRYGPVIASLPQLLARVKFVYCDTNAQPLQNPHIAALQLTNIETYDTVQRRKKLKNEPNAMKVDTTGSGSENGDGNGNDNNMQQNHNQNVNNLNNNTMTPMNPNGAAINSSDPSGNNVNIKNDQQIVIPNVAAANARIGGVGGQRPNVQINPIINQFRTNPVIGNLYAQNLLLAQQQRMQVQQLMAAQQAQQILRPRPFANARVIITPSPQQNPAVTPQIIRGQPLGHSALPGRAHPPQASIAMPPPNNQNMHQR